MRISGEIGKEIAVGKARGNISTQFKLC